MKCYLFDTSALVSFHKNEAGASEVESLFRQAQRGKCRSLISFMSVMEMFYLSWQQDGKAIAYRTYLQLKMLPIERIESSETILIRASELKARYSLSLADSWIAATAWEENAILVHKDPEFETLGDQIQLRTLPYK